MSRQAIDEIKRRLDLRTLVAERGITLKGGGEQKLGLCPFHGDKHPSLNVGPMLWICRSCGRGGDAFRWLEEEGLSFRDALDELARRAGVALPERRESGPTRAEIDRLQEAVAWAASWYAGQLSDSGRDHLEQRGIPLDVIGRFGIGQAPPFDARDKRWDQLTVASRSAGWFDELAALQLVTPRRNDPNTYYDQLRNRLIFPIRNWSGRVVGFSGRTLEAAGAAKPAAGAAKPPPRYMNSHESPLFKKGGELFGLYEARRAIREQRRAIVVEGNVDVLAMHAAELDCTVAPCGTALTADQVVQLVRAVGEHNQVVFMLDGDRAGRAAAATWLPEILVHPVDVWVVRLPEGEDPASVWASRGRAGLDDFLADARAGIDELLEAICPPGAAATPATKAKAARDLRPMLAKCDAVMRTSFAEASAKWLGVEAALFESWLHADGAQPQVAAKTIVCRAGETHIQVQEAALALKARHPNIFARAGFLVRVEGTKIRVLSSKSMPSLLDSSARWLKETVDKKTDEVVHTPISVPQRVAEALAAGEEHGSLQPLSGVMDAPFLKPDGSVRQTPGYDEATELYLVERSRFVPIPEKPGLQEAAAAVGRLVELFEDFPFDTAADASAALAALFTAVCRPAMPLAPMFVFDAPKQGTGKSLIPQAIMGICLGRVGGAVAVRRDPDKTWRDLEAKLLSGGRFIFLDNQVDDSVFDSPQIEQFVTAPYTEIRPFSSNNLEEPMNIQTVFMTANNVSFRGGMARRVTQCRLDAKMENPEFRGSFKIKHFIEHCIANRQQIIADVLTVVAGAVAAGADQGEDPAPLGSFGQWDARVRRALLWVGLADPVRPPTNNAEKDKLGEFLLAWKEVFGFKPIQVRAVSATLAERDVGTARDFLASCLKRKSKDPSQEDIGQRKARYVGKPAAGLVLVAGKAENKSLLRLCRHVDGRGPIEVDSDDK